MVNCPSKDVRDGFDTPVGVPREPGLVVLWCIIPEIVEEKERIEFCRVRKSKCAF